MRRPELRGRPVVVAGTGPRAVVTTASYEARRYGVFSAIPAARARRLCPEAVFLPPDFEAYRAMSKRVMDRVRAQVDTVEVAGLDEAYLDLSGIYSPRAAMRRLVSEIEADTGLGCSVGIGPNRLVAKVCLRRREARGLRRAHARAGVRALRGRPAAAAARDRRRRRRSGSRRSGSRRSRSSPRRRPRRWPSASAAALGPYLMRPRALRGRDARSRPSASRSRSRARRPSRPTSPTAPSRSSVLRRLAGELCEGLAKHDRRGRTIAIKVRLDDFTTVTRARTIAAPTNDAAVVADVACALLERVRAGAAACGCSACAWRRSPSPPRRAATTRRSSRSRSRRT